MDELEQISVNDSGEDRLGDGLPAHDDGKVHGRVHCLSRTVNEGLAGVSNSVDKFVDRVASDNSLATVELACNSGIEVKRLVTEPRTPVELLDAVVAAVHDLVDRCITRLGVVDKAKG